MTDESTSATAGANTSPNPKRSEDRLPDQLRGIHFQNNIAPHATGSTLIEWGNTRVVCGVTIEEKVPRWMKEQKKEGGWITAEYSMLPYSTHSRKQRDATRGKIDGRSQEIQRLIGRAIRAAVDLKKLGPRTIWVDCDVLQADGGTRTASITGGFVALSLAIQTLIDKKLLKTSPIINGVAAVSMGVVNGVPLLDLNYEEDVNAEVDMNLVMTDKDEYIELQGTGEKGTFHHGELTQLIDLGTKGVKELIALQQQAIAANT
ncbi:MAG: ribonuclease PH [Verrucomicrobia bacterium]|jgi:ribonuclease PH|nr:ribonuclease PH [Verrucomicrobiota bacterium]